MIFNWLDYVLIGAVATVAAIQFLRSTKDFSRVLYEALFMVGAVTPFALTRVAPVAIFNDNVSTPRIS